MEAIQWGYFHFFYTCVFESTQSNADIYTTYISSIWHCACIMYVHRYTRPPEQSYHFNITRMLIYLNVAVEELLINYNTPLIIHSHCMNFKNWWSLHNDNKNRSSPSLSLSPSLLITHFVHFLKCFFFCHSLKKKIIMIILSILAFCTHVNGVWGHWKQRIGGKIPPCTHLSVY